MVLSQWTILSYCVPANTSIAIIFSSLLSDTIDPVVDGAVEIDMTSGTAEADGLRTQLSNLLNYMDGKSGAEDLIAKLLKDDALLNALAAAPNPEAKKEKE